MAWREFKNQAGAGITPLEWHIYTRPSTRPAHRHPLPGPAQTKLAMLPLWLVDAYSRVMSSITSL